MPVTLPPFRPAAAHFLASRTCSPPPFSPGQKSCFLCEAGSFQNGEGQSSCKSCTAGKYADTQGLDLCKNCGAGTYQVSGCRDAPRRAATHSAPHLSTVFNAIARSSSPQLTSPLVAPGPIQNENRATSCKDCAEVR